MKWYRPGKTIKEFESNSKMLAAIAVCAITLSLVAIFIALGKGNNAA